MAERLSPKRELEELLMKVHQQPGLRDGVYDRGIPREDFAKVSNLSKFFLQLFDASKNDFHPNSLDVIIPGSSFYEVIGVLLAAKASGITEVNVTCLELDDREAFQAMHRDKLSEIFQTEFEGNSATLALPGQTGESETRARIPLGKVTMQLTDASSPELASLLVSDAAMVFVGNAEETDNTRKILTNWATIGRRSGKPLLLAATATHMYKDERLVGDSFREATREGFKMVFDGITNKHALDRIASRNMTHTYVFAAVRK